MSADPFAGVAGHQRALRLLAGQLASGRLPHAYLFSGEHQLGKTTVARRLAATLLPQAPLERHPDYWEDDRSVAVRMDEIRLIPDRGPEAHIHSLQQFLSMKPALGERRVAVLADVGRLAEPQQALLLKQLEEAHPGQVIIVTTPSLSPFVVLPTVVSRCQRVAFHGVSLVEVASLLRAGGVEPERADLLAELSRGRPGWALRAAADPQVPVRHAEWSERLERVFGAPADAALRLAAELDAANFQWRGRVRQERALDPAGTGEGAESAAAGDPVVFVLSSWQLHLRRRMLDATGPARGRWAHLIERSYDTIGFLEQNVSPRLALECFLLECRLAS